VGRTLGEAFGEAVETVGEDPTTLGEAVVGEDPTTLSEATVMKERTRATWTRWRLVRH
jgi:hypothetical protein